MRDGFDKSDGLGKPKFLRHITGNLTGHRSAGGVALWGRGRGRDWRGRRALWGRGRGRDWRGRRALWGRGRGRDWRGRRGLWGRGRDWNRGRGPRRRRGWSGNGLIDDVPSNRVQRVVRRTA